MNKTKQKPNATTIYHCPDKVVKVVKQTKGLRRFPYHGYECVLYILSPKAGTRVAPLPDGRVEFLPAWEDLRTMICAILPQLAKTLPASLKNKPLARKRRWDAFNKRRHLEKE